MTRARLISLAVGLTLGIGVLAATGLAVTIRSSSVPGKVPATKVAAKPTQPTLSVALVLTTTTVKAGGEISGQLVVENRTGYAINQVGCHGIFQVLLASSTYTPGTVWPDCWQRIAIPNGQSSIPVSVPAAYNVCGQLGAIGNIPACTPVGMPPLPPGTYFATTFEDGNALPLPAPVEVTVT